MQVKFSCLFNIDLNTADQERYQKSMQWLQQGQFEKALPLCEEILTTQPRHTATLQLKGICALRLGHLEKAYQAFKLACELEPNQAVYYVNMGEACHRLGMHEEALSHLEKAIQINPDFGGAHYNLANIYKKEGQLEQALEAYRKATQLEPHNPQYTYNLANTLFEMGYQDQAIRQYEHTLHLNPQYYHAHYNLGIIYNQQNRWSDAIQCLQTALTLKPDYEEALSLLGLTFEAQGQLESAQSCLQQRLKVSPDNQAIQLHLKTLHPLINLTNYEIESYQNRLPEEIQNFKDFGFCLQGNEIHEQLHPSSTLIYQGQNNRQLLANYASLFNTSFKDLRQVKHERKNPKPHIGFVVTQNHAGIFTKFMKNLLNRLPSHRYRLSIVTEPGEFKNVISPALEHPDIQLLPLPSYFEKAAEAIAEAQFDLLYHWEVGSDAMNYFLPFLKLAPIQCSSLGWPQTSGISEMDYFISSQKLETQEAQEHYTEKLHLFNGLPFDYDWPIFPQQSMPLENFGLNPSHHHYLCVQNLRKIHPDFDPIIADILRQDPKGRIVFIAHQSQYLTERIKIRIQVTQPDIAERVIFLPRLSWNNYLSLLKHVEVILDTPYYGGANTSLEAFAAGTPIVTLPWHLERGRYTQACYRLLDLSEAIAESPEDYANIAVRIATQAEYRQHLRHQILGRNGILFNQPVVQEYLDFFEMALNQ